MESVGVISLVYDVSKDLYAYYVAVKECDADIKELRTQLLLLQHTSTTLAGTLGRDGLRNEDKSQVEEAVNKCVNAANGLKSALDRFNLDGVQPQKAFEKVKALGRKIVYPFKKSTVAALAENAETCCDALQSAMSRLQLDNGATIVEQLHDLDDKLVAGTVRLELALRDLQLSDDAAKDEIIQMLLQHRKLLTDATQEKKTLAIVSSLKYPEMFDRIHGIAEADESSLGWLFTQKSREFPELTSLMTFLNQDNGLFWIRGKPASGKSTFVKYLLNRSNGRDRLWDWSGEKNVVFASHFCWIAGSPIQRSQQGLLRSILHQILSSDLSLVPIACPSHWDSGAYSGSWYEKELWACVYAATAASTKRICFFIDGLDEVEPEKDHATLAKAIARLSTYNNVKVVASSRPWPVFERIFRRQNRILTMENINRLPIINYIRNELENNTVCETFAHVDWVCIRASRHCPTISDHKHIDAHKIVRNIANRANGNFLWIVLIMDALCRQINSGCPINALRSYVDKLPSKLEEYFQTMIFKRVHESVISESAMALKIALLNDSSLSYLALLCEYTESGESLLMNADFCSALPCSSCTSVELEDVMLKTSRFLHGCCRDIISFNWSVEPQNRRERFVNLEYEYYERRIKFTHRTIFDFLHSSKMQDLLARHVPKHFLDDSFEDQLRIASCKMAYIDENERFNMHHIGGRLQCSIRNKYGDEYLKLATIAEEVALHQIKIISKLVSRPQTRQQWRSFENCTTLSIELSAFGLFKFTDTVMQLAPQLLTTAIEVSRGLEVGPVLFGHEGRFDLEILTKLLQAGFDCNAHPRRTHKVMQTPYTAETAWRSLVRRLRSNKYSTLECNDSSSKTSHLQESQDLAKGDYDISQRDFFADPCVQDAVKLFIEYGADFTYLDAEMLRTCMPETMTDGRDWSEFLLTYFHSDKRQELREDRKDRIRHWPENFWNDCDRKLLGLETREEMQMRISGRKRPW